MVFCDVYLYPYTKVVLPLLTSCYVSMPYSSLYYTVYK